jgi:hypothetical protein
MNRRHFLTGLAGILASGVAPAVLPAGSIMRVKSILLPGDDFDWESYSVVIDPWHGLRWTDEEIAVIKRIQAENPRRPTLTINRLAQYIRLPPGW